MDRTFVSASKFCALCQVLTRYALPGIGLVSLAGAAYFAVDFLRVGIVPRTHDTFVVDWTYAIIAALIMAVLLPNVLAGLYVSWFFNQDMNKHTIYVSNEGLRQILGKRKQRCRWEEITALKRLPWSRVQRFDVKFPSGRIRIHSPMIEVRSETPVLKHRFWHNVIEYPGGETIPLDRLDTNPLYRLILKYRPDLAPKNRGY